jgi:hypothetical protein
MEYYITRQKGQRPFRARARLSVLPGDRLFYFLFYFQVSQEHPSLISAIDAETPDLPMKIVSGV